MTDQKPVPTGVQHTTEPCPWCRGTGRHPRQLDGWYVVYHLQDGTERAGPYTEEEAVRVVITHTDQSCRVALVGPDGQFYTVEEAKK